MPTPFNTDQWLKICERLSKQAGQRCGQSDFLYVKFFSREIDEELAVLDPVDKAEAEKIARKFDYASPEERQEGEKENANSGLCKHGLDPDCCPAGCGDIDD